MKGRRVGCRTGCKTCPQKLACFHSSDTSSAAGSLVDEALGEGSCWSPVRPQRPVRSAGMIEAEECELFGRAFPTTGIVYGTEIGSCPDPMAVALDPAVSGGPNVPTLFL